MDNPLQKLRKTPVCRDTWSFLATKNALKGCATARVLGNIFWTDLATNNPLPIFPSTQNASMLIISWIAILYTWSSFLEYHTIEGEHPFFMLDVLSDPLKRIAFHLCHSISILVFQNSMTNTDVKVKKYEACNMRTCEHMQIWNMKIW